MTCLHHGGGRFGFSSECDFYPEQGSGVVLLVNRAGEIESRLPQLASTIRQRII